MVDYVDVVVVSDDYVVWFDMCVGVDYGDVD